MHVFMTLGVEASTAYDVSQAEHNVMMRDGSLYGFLKPVLAMLDKLLRDLPHL